MTAPSLFSEDDLYLFGEGTWLRSYEKLGAHPRTAFGAEGVNFAVWAPNAMGAAVDLYGPVGVERRVPMQRRSEIGIWEVFVPDIRPGTLYKYALLSRYGGYRTEKTDPYGFYAEVRPRTASIVCDLSGFSWGDGEWMARRSTRDPFANPLAVYEVHLGSWRRGDGGRFLTYREAAHQLVPYVLEHGFTHVELLPVTEHPFDASFGYQTTGYFAPTSRYGTPHDFMYFVDYCHRHGVGVLMDWVPGHFAKEGHGLGFFDGTHLFEHADPRRGQHLEWGVFIFNFERHEIHSFLLSSADYWLRYYHLDGFRVDAVTAMIRRDYDRREGAWVPNEYGGPENFEAISFLQRLNDVVHREHPGVVTCAEEATSWQGVTWPASRGGLGFDLKWNMGWMNDVLRYVKRDPLDKTPHHHEITFSYTYAFDERFILPLSHDEVIHLKGSILTKMPGDRWQRFAGARALYAMMYAHPGKKLLFMGDEFGQWREWAYAEQLEWYLLDGEPGLPHRQLLAFVAELNRLYAAIPALHVLDVSPEGFAWIDGTDAGHSVVATLRRGREARDVVAVVCNWQPVPAADYRIGVPLPGRWVELLNSDDERYGGFGVGNRGGRLARPEPLDGYEYSLSLTLPPLAVLWLRPAEESVVGPEAAGTFAQGRSAVRPGSE